MVKRSSNSVKVLIEVSKNSTSFELISAKASAVSRNISPYCLRRGEWFRMLRLNTPNPLSFEGDKLNWFQLIDKLFHFATTNTQCFINEIAA